jgi:hypothetical protein
VHRIEIAGELSEPNLIAKGEDARPDQFGLT